MVSAICRAWSAATRGNCGRHPRHFQNVIAVLVLGDIEAFDLAVLATRGDDRHFPLERHEGFEDAGLAADLAPGGLRIGAVADRRLAFAVIAEAARFQHRRPSNPLDHRRELAGLGDRGKVRGADAEPRDEDLFREAILGRRENLRVGQHRNARREKGRGLGRNVFEFVGDHIHVGGEAVERLGIGVIGHAHPVHHIEGRRVRVRRKHMALEAEPRGRQRQHAAKLAAAQDTDRGLRLESGSVHAQESFGSSATEAVCRARQASRRSLSAGSLNASTLAASSAALMAPACPIASVPTGTPGGICTME